MYLNSGRGKQRSAYLAWCFDILAARRKPGLQHSSALRVDTPPIQSLQLKISPKPASFPDEQQQVSSHPSTPPHSITPSLVFQVPRRRLCTRMISFLGAQCPDLSTAKPRHRADRTPTITHRKAHGYGGGRSDRRIGRARYASPLRLALVKK